MINIPFDSKQDCLYIARSNGNVNEWKLNVVYFNTEI